MYYDFVISFLNFTLAVLDVKDNIYFVFFGSWFPNAVLIAG